MVDGDAVQNQIKIEQGARVRRVRDYFHNRDDQNRMVCLCMLMKTVDKFLLYPGYLWFHDSFVEPGLRLQAVGAACARQRKPHHARQYAW